MDNDTIVDDWRKNAERHDDENYEFLRSMKFRDYGFDPDELAGELHEHVFQIVDCTRCANGCKTMDIKFSDEDVDWIAGHLDIATTEFIEAYLEADKTKRMARTKLGKSRARISAKTTAVQFTKCGPRSVGSTRTRTRMASHSERWALPTIHWSALLCSGLSSR